MLKKLAILPLIMFALNACSDDSSPLESLQKAGKLTKEEREFLYQKDLAEEIQSCIEQGGTEANCKTIAANKVKQYPKELANFPKAMGCWDTCYVQNNDEELCYACIETGVKNNADLIKSGKLYPGFVAEEQRYITCADAWDLHYSEHKTEEAIMEKAASYEISYYKCEDEYANALNCEGALKCDQPLYDMNDKEDDAAYAICEESDSDLFRGDQFSDEKACYNSLTYYCQKEIEALDKCQKKYYTGFNN